MFEVNKRLHTYTASAICNRARLLLKTESLGRILFFTKMTMKENEGNTFDGIKQNYSSATRRDMLSGEWVYLHYLFKCLALANTFVVTVLACKNVFRRIGKQARGVRLFGDALWSGSKFVFSPSQQLFVFVGRKEGQPNKTTTSQQSQICSINTESKIGKCDYQVTDSQPLEKRTRPNVFSESATHPEIRFYRKIILCQW